MPVGPTLIERVERTNIVVVNLQQQWAWFVPRHNLYTIDVDCERNYCNYERFGHITRNCRSQRIVE